MWLLTFSTLVFHTLLSFLNKLQEEGTSVGKIQDTPSAILQYTFSIVNLQPLCSHLLKDFFFYCQQQNYQKLKLLYSLNEAFKLIRDLLESGEKNVYLVFAYFMDENSFQIKVLLLIYKRSITVCLMCTQEGTGYQLMQVFRVYTALYLLRLRLGTGSVFLTLI